MSIPARTAPGVLFVDDEVKALSMFERAFGGRFPVRTAASAASALRVLEAEADGLGVVIADQRMPGGTGIELLREVRTRYPDKVRLLTTAYTEIDTLVGAINEGSVFRFVSKPWDLEALGAEIAEALRSFNQGERERDLLARRLADLRDAVLDQRVADIGTVAISLSHYVDNALCPFDLLIAKIVQRLGESAEDQAYLSFLQRIRAHIRTTSESISHLRLVDAPLDPEGLERVDLGELCRRSLDRDRELIGSKKLRFELEASGAPVRVTADRDRLDDFFRFMIAEEVVSSKPASTVRIRIAAEEAGGAAVEIEDETALRPGASASDFL